MHLHYALCNTCVALCKVFKCLFRHCSALEYTSTTSAPLNGNSRSLWALMSSIVENDHRERSKRRIYISTKTESCKFLTEVIFTLSNVVHKCGMCQSSTYFVVFLSGFCRDINPKIVLLTICSESNLSDLLQKKTEGGKVCW